ncbi:MAG: Flp pilus assembly protein CpaB [Spiribacter salinus]|uniref:Flp pilus assembly protein CpaB n=1 Tax=Spiribacter salinus TaxID=1335746 RepID=A0A540VUW6_9GAMM|nr:MAG: Flp pilus assembly protein CpaB [Spiribacter salinus]
MQPAIRGFLLLAGAGVAGTLGVVLGDRQLERRTAEIEAALQSEHATQPAIVASRDLAAGDRLESGNVSLREIPLTYLPTASLVEADWSSYADAELRESVAAGRPITPSQLRRDESVRLAELLETGDRAISLPLMGASSLSGFLYPADRIDLMLTYRDEGSRRTVPLLNDIPVLAVGSDLLETTQATAVSDRDITLAVSPIEAATITQAQAMGEIAVALRGELDDLPVDDFLIDAQHLQLTQKQAPAQQNAVEVIVGDRQ